MVSAANGECLNGLIEDAASKGALIAAGGYARGAVMPATILGRGHQRFSLRPVVGRVGRDVHRAAGVECDDALGLRCGGAEQRRGDQEA